MSDGPTPERPPGWSAQQPPPYGAPQASPWTAPGGASGQPYAPPPPQPPPPPPPPGHGPYQGHGAPPPPPPPGYGAHPPPPGYGYPPPPQALRPGIIPLRPLGLGDILDGSFKFIRSNPKAILGLSALAAVIVSVPAAVGESFLVTALTDVSDPGALRNGGLAGAVEGLIAGYGGLLISSVIAFVVTTILTGVLTRILGRSVFGGRLGPAEAWRLVKGRMPALFGVVLLTGLIMIAPLIPIFVIFGLLIANADRGNAIGLVGILILVMIAYLLYAVFFSTRFSFAAPAVVLEGSRPVAAMRRSWQLVGGQFWRVLGITLLTGILAYLVSMAIKVPFNVVAQLLQFGESGTVVLTAALLAIGATVASMIVYPFQAAVSAILYTDRRMREEAFDLVLQTAAIEQQRQGWVHVSADDLWHPSNSAGPWHR
ncbi:glycerophosphoryl diester phosphodiesterase membrane domain-containing protein [Nonomuraea longicatena]|uniref:Membrane protein n=1 Tax=Nonomuraea longicatena TaxID=83682 RepID=A0ABN1PG92_9ACTN